MKRVFLVLALLGFAVAFFFQSSPAATRVSALSERFEGRSVLAWGVVQAVSGPWMRVCDAGRCVSVVSSRDFDSRFSGRRVWVDGVYRQDTLFVKTPKDVDVSG
ncbi:hypothetical protein HY572_03960 [Candidatus Micrarchaeota archaeon]|nr:hypothetical protein [Candidatus Micrarchaeota archaeon]